MKFLHVLETLGTAVVGGAITGGADYLVGGGSLEHVQTAAITGAIVGAAALWRQKPSDRQSNAPTPQEPPKS